jgi:predicted ABC-type ATPase
MTGNELKIFIIAGPNGAGKTTFAEEFLPNEAGCLIFVNADLIAAGLSPFAPERVAFRAGRLMLAEIFEHARRKESFAFETTLSGRGYARLIPLWQQKGYSKIGISAACLARAGHCQGAPAGKNRRTQCSRAGHPQEVCCRIEKF